ncbi:hypothetical protein LNP74_25025 [Klebsiella pneumoniae subsp. pneumoniae]|nr:hypothetical protein [Klebsiella pneumoniae subsp. pneumoniae]
MLSTSAPSAGRIAFPTTFRCGGSLLKFRREFDQYVNLRPVRLFPGVPCPLAGKKAGRYRFFTWCAKIPKANIPPSAAAPMKAPSMKW